MMMMKAKLMIGHLRILIFIGNQRGSKGGAILMSVVQNIREHDYGIADHFCLSAPFPLVNYDGKKEE